MPWRETIIYLSPAAALAHTQSTRREGEGGGRNQGVSELPHTGFVLPPTPLCLYHIKELCFVLASYWSCASSGYNAYFKCSTKTGGVNRGIKALKYSATSALHTTGKESSLQRKGGTCNSGQRKNNQNLGVRDCNAEELVLAVEES